MANLNKVLIVGRLTRDPESSRTTGGLDVAKLGLAINSYRKGQDGQRTESTTFVEVTAFGRTATLCCQYLAKGREAFIEGELRLEQWTDKASGQPRSKLSVIANEVQFLGGKQEQRPPGNRPAPGSDEEVPF